MHELIQLFLKISINLFINIRFLKGRALVLIGISLLSKLSQHNMDYFIRCLIFGFFWILLNVWLLSDTVPIFRNSSLSHIILRYIKDDPNQELTFLISQISTNILRPYDTVPIFHNQPQATTILLHNDDASIPKSIAQFFSILSSIQLPFCTNLSFYSDLTVISVSHRS